MIKYRKGFKYQLAEDFIIQTEIYSYEFDSQFLKLTKDGWLLIRSGYAWDGPSGPTRDDKTNMEPSLYHDALYQLMRLQVIPRSYRLSIDEKFGKFCKDKGMWNVRAWWYLRGVKDFAAAASDPKNKRKIYIIE